MFGFIQVEILLSRIILLELVIQDTSRSHHPFGVCCLFLFALSHVHVLASYSGSHHVGLRCALSSIPVNSYSGSHHVGLSRPLCVQSSIPSGICATSSSSSSSSSAKRTSAAARSAFLASNAANNTLAVCVAVASVSAAASASSRALDASTLS